MFACVNFASQDTFFEHLKPSNDESAIAFYKSTGPILNRLVDSNPNYKQEVGNAIFEFVKKIAGEKDAPKITGMLIGVTISEIKRFLVNYDFFLQTISQA